MGGPLAEHWLHLFLRIPPTLDQDAALCHAAMQVEPEQPHRGGAFVGERNDLSSLDPEVVAPPMPPRMEQPDDPSRFEPQARDV